MAGISELLEPRLDPRIHRTRQLLLSALERLLLSKSIEQLSVADIAQESTVNRATFYDHYADKFELLEDFVESRFQDHLRKRNVAFDGSCPTALSAIGLATCDYLAELPHMGCPERRHMEKHFESAIISVVRGMILGGFRQHPPQSNLSPELIAAIVTGAIYGGAREWAVSPKLSSAEAVAEGIRQLISPLLIPQGSHPETG